MSTTTTRRVGSPEVTSRDSTGSLLIITTFAVSNGDGTFEDLVLRYWPTLDYASWSLGGPWGAMRTTIGRS